MKLNYPQWFYDQYHYLTGLTNDTVTHTDTKWETINNRLSKLKDLNSSILDEQPYGVIGNERGFDHLLDLMGISNYTFENINDSLIDTYRHSLKHAMGRMMVNTQSVIFKTEQMDVRNVINEEFSHYYIVDAPFNQLHFGGRDVFIREHISKMYETGTRHWMSIQDFIKTFQDDIKNGPTALLPFTMLGSINGYICNDFFIGISDQGLKFKIGWPYSADAKFILYKLDVADVYTCETDVNNVLSCSIPYESFDIRKGRPEMNTNCLVNIYDKDFIKTSPSVVNFGWFNENGFEISGIQKRTLTELERKQSTTITIVVYVLKYFHEVPGLFPAINYMQLADKRQVFDYDRNNVRDLYGNQIMSHTTEDNELETCTPPIALDRKNNKSFQLLAKGLQLKSRLLSLKPVFKRIGQQFQTQLNETTFVDKILEPILSNRQEHGLYKQLVDCFHTYQQMAIATSLIPITLIERYQRLLTRIKELSELSSNQFEESYVYNINEFNGDAWEWFVNDITDPIMNGPLEPFICMNDLISDYFKETTTNHQRFNRPVSEQCLMCLRWDAIEGAWMLHLPEIKRFKGIGNTFYIDDGLEGNEIFKFFVLYTDTENPRDTHVESVTEEQSFDFDLFTQQLDKHIGYIRYWNAENRLLKMSHVLYQRYDDETITNTLSKLLKNIVDGNDILNIDLSDINYEASGITTSNVEDYDVWTEEAPFVLNYLFYTLSNLQGNEDKLQSYFYHQLVMKRYHKRYFDMLLDTDGLLTYPINYSKFTMIDPEVLNIRGFLMGDDIPIDEGGYNLEIYEDDTIGYLPPDSQFIVERYGQEDDDVKLVVSRGDENDTNIMHLGTVEDDTTTLSPEEIDEYWSNANFQMTTLPPDMYEKLVGDNYLQSYYGIPSIYKNNLVHIKGHPFVFHVYHEKQKHFLIVKNGLHEERHVCPPVDDYKTISFCNEIELARRFTFYLTYVYNCLTDIQTNFTTSFSQQSIVDTHYETIEREIALLIPFRQKEYYNQTSLDMVNTIVYDNPLLVELKRLKQLMQSVTRMNVRTQNRSFVAFINQLITHIRIIHKNYGFDDVITRRVQNLYNHLRLINHQSMTCYQFKEWLRDIDITLLQNLDTLFADNENHNTIDMLFYDQSKMLADHIERVIPILDDLNTAITTLHIKMDSHKKGIIKECLRIMKYYIFDLYVIKTLPSFLDLTFQHEPYVIQATVKSKSHINIPNVNRNASTKLYFQPVLDRINDAYYIRELVKICEYTFFDGGDIDVEIDVITSDGKQLLPMDHDSKTQTITFQKIGSTADDVMDFDMLVGIQQLMSNFKNIHQNITSDPEGNIINRNHTELNYELLHGNHLIQLHHTTQHKYDETEYGPFDRVELLNHMLNELNNIEYGKRLHHQLFFKPVQIIIPYDNIKPIGSRYFVGQTLYLKTKDGKCVFPITVTALDHHINKGFIEACVSPRSKWFEMTSIKDVKHYFCHDIDCEIMDGNISNFLDEFTNKNYNAYSNTNWNKMVRDYDTDSMIPNTVSVPGDPIYVQNNAPFVYTRLAWMFHELVPNRFIDDQRKQQRFLYIGNFSSYDAEQITIHMINVNFNTLTIQEQYPILREEPNDHSIWEEEIKTFTKIKEEAILKSYEILEEITKKKKELETNLQHNVRLDLETSLERNEIDYQEQIELKNRMQSYLDHLEPPTDWHNVRSYDDALVYINNGRTYQSSSFVPNIRDIPYNDKLDVFLFDWEHKNWLDPNTYDITSVWEDNIQIQQHVDYQSNHVLHRIIIKPKKGFCDSKSLLVYISYNKSDIFNDVEKELIAECKVRFKPILSLPNRQEVFEPYKELAIRKHVNAEECYVFE